MTTWEDAPKAKHYMDFTISPGTIVMKPRCDGEVGDQCRLVCDKACEEYPCYDEEGHRHTFTDSGQCNITLFLESDEELLESYNGAAELVVSRVINPEWCHEFYEWNLTKEAT